MSESNVEEIVSSEVNALVAIVDLEGKVYVWDLRKEAKVSEFHSFWDIGGRRLAISMDGALCAVGAYNRFGITMHETSDGKMLWQKKSLKKVQRLNFSRHRDALFVEIDLRSFHIVNSRTGDVLEKIPGVEGIYESPFGGFVLMERKSKGLELIESESHKKIAKLPRTSFAVIDAFFTENSIIIRESGHYPNIRPSVSCYSLSDGNLVWRYTTPSDFDITEMGYRVDRGELLVVKNYNSLVAFDKKEGRITRQIPIEKAARAGFALAGTRLITWTGKVLDTITGEVVSTLGFPSPQPT